MRTVATPAVLGVVGMLINKGAFFVRMALRAEVLDREFLKQFLC